MEIPHKSDQQAWLQYWQAVLAGKTVLTFEEFCLYTGYSRSYGYKLTSGRIVPHFKPTHGRCFFNRLEIDAWLQSRSVPTAADLEQAATNYTTTKKGSSL